MSFILDAIAKSERERRQLEVPDTQLLAIPAETVPAKKRLLPFLLIVALMLNAILVAVWIQSEKIAETKIENVSVVTPLPKDKAETEVVEDSIIKAQDNRQKLAVVKAPEPEEEQVADGWVRVEPNTLQQTARVIGENAAVTKTPDTSEKITVSRLYDLPESVRKDLPSVKFSGHLYSSDPASSVVFLDNQRPVMQGQRIVDEVFLNEITPDGVVVEFRGYLIQVGVLQNWTLN